MDLILKIIKILAIISLVIITLPLLILFVLYKIIIKKKSINEIFTFEIDEKDLHKFSAKNEKNSFNIEEEPDISEEEEDDEDDINDNDKRLLKIFFSAKNKVPRVSIKTLEVYRNYLMNNLDISIKYTGIQDFSWEEPYVWGNYSKKKYEKLKKSNPSYTDQYFLRHLQSSDDFYGIMVQVQRISDNRKFNLPLADLKTVVESSKSFQELEDYSYWFFNFR